MISVYLLLDSALTVLFVVARSTLSARGGQKVTSRHKKRGQKLIHAQGYLAFCPLIRQVPPTLCAGVRELIRVLVESSVNGQVFRAYRIM